MVECADAAEAEALALDLRERRDAVACVDVELRGVRVRREHDALRRDGARGHAHDGRAAAADVDVADDPALDELGRDDDAGLGHVRRCRGGDELRHLEAVAGVDPGFGSYDERQLRRRDVAELDSQRHRGVLCTSRCATRE